MADKIKFESKVFISGKIEVLTGLHIGGSKSSLEIGGIDLSVIKTADGNLPFIPGSSLKGKLRTMLARAEGSTEVKKDPDSIKEIFGYSGDENEDEGDREKAQNASMNFTRLIVRDAFLDQESFEKTFEEEELLDTPYTEYKWENTINRKTGTAEHPRVLERVPAGARFSFELIYNSFDDGKEEKHINEILKAMRLLEDDYLGGHGSRGYGRISFGKPRFERKRLEDYKAGTDRSETSDYTY